MSIRIDGTNTTANPGITGSDTDTGLQLGTNEVKVVTGGTEQATFDDSGNLVLDGGSDVRIELGSNGTTETNDRNHIRGDGDNIKYNSCDAGQHIFEVNGTERMSISSNGSTTLTTNSTDTSVTDVTQLVLKNSSDAANTMAGIRFEASSNSDSDYFIVHKKHGSGTGADLIVQRGSNERLRFIESGGIAFNGDTAAANALDDYEEGTWTPTAVNYSGTLTVNTASYVKIGKLCFVHGYVSLSNTTDSSDIILDGLPFTGFGANNNYYVISAHTNGGLEELNLRAQGTSSQLAAVHLSGGDGDSKPTYTSLANKFVIFSGCFKTT